MATARPIVRSDPIRSARPVQAARSPSRPTAMPATTRARRPLGLLLTLCLLPLLDLEAGCAAVANPAGRSFEGSPPPPAAILQEAQHEQPQVGHAVTGRHAIWREHPDHLALVIGGKTEEEEGERETEATLGLDYEHRVNDFLGIGSVIAEYAFGDIDALTILAVADLHLWRGFIVQTGPGIESIDKELEGVYRIGALYELEFGRYTVAPQVHYDATTGEDAVVFGVSLGYYL